MTNRQASPTATVLLGSSVWQCSSLGPLMIVVVRAVVAMEPAGGESADTLIDGPGDR